MKKFSFQFSKKGRKTFLSLPKSIRNKIEEKLRYFLKSKNPLSFSSKIVGSKNYFRFRIGNYRVIFTPKENGEIVILLMLKVAHRKDVYE